MTNFIPKNFSCTQKIRCDVNGNGKFASHLKCFTDELSFFPTEWFQTLIDWKGSI